MATKDDDDRCARAYVIDAAVTDIFEFGDFVQNLGMELATLAATALGLEPPKPWIQSTPEFEAVGPALIRIGPDFTVERGRWGSTCFTLLDVIVPDRAGIVQLEIRLDFEEIPPNLVQVFAGGVAWAATADADPMRYVAAAEGALSRLGPFSMEEPDEDSPQELVAVLLSTLDAALRRNTAKLQSIMEAPPLVRLQEASAEAAREFKRSEKRLQKHIDQLKGELETAKVQRQRQSDRASLAERQLRALAAQHPVAPPSGATETAPDGRLRILEDRLTHETNVREQLEKELSRLKSELYQASVRGTEVVASQPVPLSTSPDFPESLQSLSAWAQATISDRITVHTKAVRAARKSAFADSSLVYRVLSAMHDHYWPMKFGNDKHAMGRWTAFLTTERLSCSPTGWATNDHRTADRYRVTWRGKTLPLDLHLQGHSGRDEARAFRLYFGVDLERKMVIVGHLPTHLPNTLS